METRLPEDVTKVLDDERRRLARRGSGFSVIAGDQTHPVIELKKSGFVIAADGRPPLRGFADIMRGDERVGRGLVVCTWAEDGRVGYEFKRDSAGMDAPVDYVLPAHSGLLDAPLPD